MSASRVSFQMLPLKVGFQIVPFAVVDKIVRYCFSLSKNREQDKDKMSLSTPTFTNIHT